MTNDVPRSVAVTTWEAAAGVRPNNADVCRHENAGRAECKPSEAALDLEMYKCDAVRSSSAAAGRWAVMASMLVAVPRLRAWPLRNKQIARACIDDGTVDLRSPVVAPSCARLAATMPLKNGRRTSMARARSCSTSRHPLVLVVQRPFGGPAHAGIKIFHRRCRLSRSSRARRRELRTTCTGRTNEDRHRVAMLPGRAPPLRGMVRHNNTRRQRPTIRRRRHPRNRRRARPRDQCSHCRVERPMTNLAFDDVFQLTRQWSPAGGLMPASYTITARVTGATLGVSCPVSTPRTSTTTRRSSRARNSAAVECSAPARSRRLSATA